VVEEDWSLTSAAAAAEVSEPTARKWVRRYRPEGEAGLLDRPSAAHRVHNRTAAERIGVIRALRGLRFTGAEIAEALAMPEITVSGILTRIGLGRLGWIGLEPAQRYERSKPGELIHIDVKKLGRIGPDGADHRVTGRRPGPTGRSTPLPPSAPRLCRAGFGATTLGVHTVPLAAGRPPLGSPS
jgi:hypothetical protein